MERLDLIVFVPIEEPDRMAASETDQTEWRQRVDEDLREIVLDDRWDLGLEALEVTGTLRDRVRQVLAWVGDV